MQRGEFFERGYLRLAGALGPGEVTAMRDAVWTTLEARGVRRDDRATWPVGPVSGLQAIRRADTRPSASARLRAVIDELFGVSTWKEPKDWGQALVTFPNAGEWSPPRHLWHLDHPFWFPPDRVSGVNVFLFLGDVGPSGGGTLALEGSPALVERFVAGQGDVRHGKQKTLRKRFDAAHAWLTTTPLDSLMGEGVDVEGVRARVVELTGSTGDVAVCHPWLLHSPSSNVSARPRMMRASRIYRRGLIAALDDS